MSKTSGEKTKIVQPKKSTLKSITYSICGLMILGILILTVVALIQIENFLREELRLRITDVVHIMAEKIDGDLHNQVQTVTDDKSAAFIKLKNDLVKMRERSTDIANIYTMRKMDDGTFRFIVDGSAKDQNAIGDIYPNESVTETLNHVFNATPENNTIYTETEVSKDDWGVWLSAFAPIFTSSNKLDGIIGIDVSAESIQKHSLQFIGTISITSVCVIFFTLPFLIRFMNFIKVMMKENEQSNLELKLQQYALDQHAIVSITDKSGKILYVNQRFCDISGYTSEELLGQDHRLLNSGYHPKTFFMDMWQTIARKETWHGNVCNQTKHGKFYWAQSTIVPLTDANGHIDRYISMRTDITAQKEMEHIAIKSEEWQRTILNNLGDGVYTLDSSGKVSYLNSVAEEMLGWRFSEIKGKLIHDIIHYQTATGEPLSFECCPISVSMRNNKIYRSDDEIFFHKEGHSIQISIVGAPLLDDGKLIGSVACFRDVSSQKLIQEQLRQAKEAAEQASRLKSDFLSTMSHEIRTPMNGIIGMTDLLLDTSLDEEQLEFASIVKSSANSLLGIINDILDFSKIEANQLEIDQIEFSLQQLIEDCTDVVSTRAHEKSLTLVSYIDPQIPILLRGDSMRLRQILLNFLSNAVKFTAKGSVMAKALLLSKSESLAWIRFEITDNGIGISPETQQRLFQPFSQADSSTTRKYGGTGLGLSICKRLIELMHGHIGIKSTIGEGSTFWVELPLEIAILQTQEMDISKVKNRVILVSGQQAGHHEVYIAYLKSWGMDVHSCESKSEMQMLLQQTTDNKKPYEALLLAGFSTDELLNTISEIRAEERLLSLPIIVCQASRESSIRHGLIDCGANKVLTSPVKKSTLFNSLIEIFYKHEPIVTETKQVVKTNNDVSVTQTHRLLLVEDNVVNQQIATRLLAKMGYAVDIANNGQEAFDILAANHRYDLVLMDCQMPLMDGFETTRAIRKYEVEFNKKALPIVAMTANAIHGDKERCLAAGMNDYVTKPIDAHKLSTAIKNWLPSISTLNTVESIDELKEVVEKNAASPIEMRRMLELFDDDEEVIDELLSVFLDSLDSLKMKLTTAVANRATDIKAIAHEIKGSAYNVGAVILATLTGQLEQAASQQNWVEIEVLTTQIEAEIDRAKHFIKNRK